MADDRDENSEHAEGGPVKTFLEHLEDFRWVLVKSAVALSLAMVICLIAGNHIVQILEWPLKQADPNYPIKVWNRTLGWAWPLKNRGSYSGTNQIAVVNFGTNHIGNFQLSPEQQKNFNLGTNHFVAIQVEPVTMGTNHILSWRIVNDPAAISQAQHMQVELINLHPAGGFFVAFQVAFYAGMVLAAFPILYFVASFVFPALKWNERKYVYRGLFFGGGLFIIGISFCYFVLMPVALAASQMYSNWLGFGAMQWRAEDYISFVCKFMLGMGLGFELPVVLLILVKLDVLRYRTLRGMWRYMIVINLVLGALLTTPEVITQLLMALPLYMLYEVSVWIAWYWDRKERKRTLQNSISA
jgi:sec-independent protein translocase protein TatC